MNTKDFIILPRLQIQQGKLSKPHLTSYTYSYSKRRMWLCYASRTKCNDNEFRLANTTGHTPKQAYQRYIDSLNNQTP